MIERRHFVVDGLRLSFLEQGEAGHGRPTFVLLHGLMGCADTFVPLIESIGPEIHIIALDLPGAGQSERRPDIDAGLLPTAELVARFISALRLQKPILAGHSHGGAVALSIAARHRDLVRSLVLLAPAHPYFDEGDPLIRFYLSLPGRLFAYSMPWLPAWMQLLCLRKMAGRRSCDTHKNLRPYRDNLRTPGTMSHLLRLLQSWKKDFSGLAKALRKPIATPALIVWGDYDRAVPLHSAPGLRERLLHSELVVLPLVGHRPAEEVPNLVADLMRDWCERDSLAESIRYSPKFSPSHARITALIPSSLEAGD